MEWIIVGIITLIILGIRWAVIGWALWFILALVGVNFPFMSMFLMAMALDVLFSFSSKKKGE